MHPNTRAAIAAGRRRWVERMRAAKARGEIERFPGGKRARGLPPLSRDPTIRKAQRIVERLMAEQTGVQAITNEAVPPRTWDDLTKAEKLSRAADLALDCARQILELGIDRSDVKLVAQVKDTALNIISQQIRLDSLKELQVRGDAPAAKVRDEEQRLLALAFSELGVRHPQIIEAPISADDGEERAGDGD